MHKRLTCFPLLAVLGRTLVPNLYSTHTHTQQLRPSPDSHLDQCLHGQDYTVIKSRGKASWDLRFGLRRADQAQREEEEEIAATATGQESGRG